MKKISTEEQLEEFLRQSTPAALCVPAKPAIKTPNSLSVGLCAFDEYVELGCTYRLNDDSPAVSVKTVDLNGLSCILCGSKR